MRRDPADGDRQSLYFCAIALFPMEPKPVITWQLWAVLGGLVLLVFGIIRPAVCGSAWETRSTMDPILQKLDSDLKGIGVEPIKDERPRGFCG